MPVTPSTIDVVQKHLESDRRWRERRHPQWTLNSKVEHVFGVMKLKFGFVKLRYRRLKKNANQLFAVCAW